LEDSVTSSEDGKLTVGTLVAMFEASEDASYDSRVQAERDRDYHDNKQLTDDELKALKKRGQPPYIDNRIKTKVDYLVGLEKQQRVNPKALPRTPAHEGDADAAGQAMNYVADKENYDSKRSASWRNLLVEGACGIGVTVKQDKKGEWYICLNRWSWDRLFWDPHSAELDFSDAGYLGTVQWMDYDDALALYSENPDAGDILDATLTQAPSDTYDDKPRWNLWADKKRKRVRIVAIWVKRGEDWHFAEFTKGGILKAGPSPYVDDQGNSECELVFQSAYCDRDNNRFGLVREMIYLQDGINKRGSKAQHLLNTAQIVMTRDAVDESVNTIEEVRRQAARPDGIIMLNPGNGALKDRFEFNTRTDLAAGQVQMQEAAIRAIETKGPNATQMGEKTAMGSASASGKAILASQQGGMISLGDLLDNLKHLDYRVFRAVWNRIRQFWTAEKWIRVTDDDRNIKWVGINVPQEMQQMYAQQGGERISGMIGSIAELDCDIIIDSSPLSPQAEQFSALVELKQAGVMIPDKALIRSMPNFQGKQQMMKEMEEPNPVQETATELELEGKDLENKKTGAETMKIIAEAQGAGGMEQPAGPDPLPVVQAVTEAQLAEREQQTKADIEARKLAQRDRELNDKRELTIREQDINREMRLREMSLVEVETDDGQGGKKKAVKDKADVNAEQLAEGFSRGLTLVAQLVANEGQATRDAILQSNERMVEATVRVGTAPVNLLFEKGRVVGAVKELQP
jgi:hypothetical protein